MKNVASNPARHLKATNVFISGATAAPIEHTIKRKIAHLYAMLRPKILLMGAQIKELMPMAHRMPAFEMLMTSPVVPNSCAISGTAGKSEVEENVAAREIQDAVQSIATLREIGYLS
jgi:hypothetical protein